MARSRKKKTKNRRRKNLKGGAPENTSAEEKPTEEKPTEETNEELIAQKIAENEIKKEEVTKVNKNVKESDKVRERIKKERYSITQNVNTKDVKFEDAAVQLRYYEDEFDKKLAELNAIKELLERARDEYNESKRNYQYSQIDKLKYPK
jgi:hypothetical protein